MSTALRYAFDHGKQGSMDLLCDWSNCDKTWQMSPKYDDCLHDGCTQSIFSVEEQSKSTANFTVSVQICSEVSAIKCTSSASKKDGFVYKRRRLHGNSFALLSEENGTTSPKGSSVYHSSIIPEEHPLTEHKDDLGRLPIMSAYDFSGVSQDVEKLLISDLSSQVELFSNSVLSNTSSAREDKGLDEVYIGDLQKFTSEPYSSVDDKYSSLKSNKGHGSTLTEIEVDGGDCSSVDAVVVEPLGEFTSVKELCISVLKTHGLLGGVWASTECASLEVLYGNDTNLSKSCKVCGLSENPLKMLICDLCEEAFHLSCCNPKVKKLPANEWFCQPCFRKKPKTLGRGNTGKSFDTIDEMAKHRDLGPILFMLKDIQPYTSGVRIGEDYQVEVPDWCGPIYDGHEFYGEPLAMDAAKLSNEDGRNYNLPFKPSSIGNWIQCREVIDENDEGTICGKWRRAPLFVVQKGDWDCSCSVLWDPIHADCSVPQELETKVILEHLRYIEMLGPPIRSRSPVEHIVNGIRPDGPDSTQPE